MLDDEGNTRKPWRPLVERLVALGEVEELRRRWDQARVLLHEHGVSYDAYGDSEGVGAPLESFAAPRVVRLGRVVARGRGALRSARGSSTTFCPISTGPRTSRERRLPPEIVFAHPGFLVRASESRRLRGHSLPLYAADLVRVAGGRMSVLADRTQAPSGAGYALENRIVLSRSLPEVFRECHVERLALFFRTMRDTLRQLAPHNRDNPRIVLLTPGPLQRHLFRAGVLGAVPGPHAGARRRSRRCAITAST